MTPEDHDDLARAVRASRALLGWGQHDLAAHTDLAVNSIRNLERARRGTRMATVTAVVRALRAAGVSMDDNGECLRVTLAKAGIAPAKAEVPAAEPAAKRKSTRASKPRGKSAAGKLS